MSSEKWSVVLTQAFFQEEVVSEHASSWTGLCDKKQFVENRNHVWRDLSRLVDLECK